jgi:small subunit ribosomal protein S4
VNGTIVNIPSFEVQPGDVITVRPKSRNLEVVEDSLGSSSRNKYSWLEIDKKSRTGKFLQAPDFEEVPENINVQLIIELYSK